MDCSLITIQYRNNKMCSCCCFLFHGEYFSLLYILSEMVDLKYSNSAFPYVCLKIDRTKQAALTTLA